jgi:circadian clock protein KaiB
MRLTGRNPRSTFERAAETMDTGRYVLKLFVTGKTPRSTRAVENLRSICDEYLEGRYDLEVIDIYQQPALLAGEQIVAAPTLVKRFPLPTRRLVGDMSNRHRVLVGLDLVCGPVGKE